jgi:hypothetical protein
MRRLLVVLSIIRVLAVVTGISADTGALPGPVETDGSSFTWPGAVSLQVAETPWGGGSVISTPGYRIDCPLACIRPFAAGSSVTLVQMPTPGYTFTEWEAANHGQPAIAGVCPGTGNCTVTMDQAKDVVAVYSPPAGHNTPTDEKGGGGEGEGFTLTVSVGGGAAGTVTSHPSGISCVNNPEHSSGSCSASFKANSHVTLTANPGANSMLEDWSGDCSGSQSLTCTLTMDGPHSAGADFEGTG